ncbi:MAG: glycogen debranching enzyme GlgX, partial [Burkholderiaceae bacterium]|nr:glycogen debranching enzyme GlgX [Burkholderiaceae bacterium]
YPALADGKWFEKEDIAMARADYHVHWLCHSGGEIDGDKWNDKSCYSMGILIRTNDNSPDCLVVINASAQEVIFRLPPGRWTFVLDNDGKTPKGTIMEFQILLNPHVILLAIQE